jgi:hypothetical protein
VPALGAIFTGEKEQRCSFSCINTNAPNKRAVMVNPYRFYTYAYLREDRTPYYIGKGTGKRLYNRCKKDIKSPKDKTKIILLKQNITEEEAFKHEIYMISVFGRKDLGTGILYNKTNGGDGCSGAIRTEETKQKIREKRALQEFTDETKLKISKALKGKKRPQNVIEKIKKGRTEIKHTEQTKQIIKEKRANQIFTEDTRKKLSEAHIGKPKPHLCKQFQIINPEGKVIDGVGIRKFCNENNLNYDNIRKILNGTQKHHKGWTVYKQ